ncbi:hypothetical protein J6590_076477 [Homalodisca vitripennis]|nr:hypothetical protein J6590_076477 [Homalodisca vitripennis]
MKSDYIRIGECLIPCGKYAVEIVQAGISRKSDLYSHRRMSDSVWQLVQAGSQIIFTSANVSFRVASKMWQMCKIVQAGSQIYIHIGECLIPWGK